MFPQKPGKKVVKRGENAKKRENRLIGEIRRERMGRAGQADIESYALFRPNRLCPESDGSKGRSYGTVRTPGVFAGEGPASPVKPA